MQPRPSGGVSSPPTPVKPSVSFAALPPKSVSSPTPGAKPGGKVDAAPPPPDGPPPGEEDEEEEDDEEEDDDAEEGDGEPPPPDRDATFYVGALQDPKSISVKDMQELKQFLGGSDRDWKNDFVQNDGMDAVAAILSKGAPINPKIKDDLTLEMLSCLEALLQEAEWLRPMLRTQGLLNHIVEKVGDPSHRIKIKAMQLLTVICWMNADGRRSVFAALDPPASGGFKGLIHLIKQLRQFDPKSPDLTTITLILVNSLINSAAALEERLDARKRLTELGIFDAIAKLNNVIPATPEDDRLNELASQLDEYDSALLKDQRETLRDGCDLSDPDAVYQYIKKTAAEDGYAPNLLAILQMLMIIPNDKGVGDKIWENVQHIVHMAVQKDDAESMERNQ